MQFFPSVFQLYNINQRPRINVILCAVLLEGGLLVDIFEVAETGSIGAVSFPALASFLYVSVMAGDNSDSASVSHNIILLALIFFLSLQFMLSAGQSVLLSD